MANEKATQKERVILEFGILIQPIAEIAKRQQAPSEAEHRTALAKVGAGDAAWRHSVRELCTFAYDVFFNNEFQEISHAAERLLRDLKSFPTNYENHLESHLKHFHDSLSRVPVDWEPEIFEANTPFTSYLRINETMSSITNRIEYFDRYLKPDFYRLFLRYVPRGVSVALVTTAGKSGTNGFGVAEVSAVSNLARQEFDDYKLLQIDPQELHDRNLRVDDQVFTLGPGTDRAGLALTNFGPSDSSPQAHAQFDAIIAKGAVIHQS